MSRPKVPTYHVVTLVRDGLGSHIVESDWIEAKQTHLSTPKWGRRVGKHHAQSKAHCLENQLIAQENHQAEIDSGFARYRENLKHL